MILASCSKVDNTPIQQIDSKAILSPIQARSQTFPISVYLGEDTACNRITSINLWAYHSYLPTCGVNPQYEAPNMGVDVYQVAGPTQTIISWANYTDNQEIPAIQGLEPGLYKFVGHAYITGYRICDSSYQNQHAYDTISITVLKRRTKVKP